MFQASHVFEFLAVGRPELRLRDLMFVFKSWKESILNAELIHQEEENKLKLSAEHPQSYYMTDTILQSGETNERTLNGCKRMFSQRGYLNI